MNLQRRGKTKYLTLELEVCTILEQMAEGAKAQGKLVSHLIRQEAWRRHEMRQARERLSQTVDEVFVG